MNFHASNPKTYSFHELDQALKAILMMMKSFLLKKSIRQYNIDYSNKTINSLQHPLEKEIYDSSACLQMSWYSKLTCIQLTGRNSEPS